MNTKKYITSIITIVVLLLLIFGATYAYFAASSNVSNVTNISANLPNYDGSIITTSDTCSITVSAADMLQGNANDDTPVATSTCHLNVTLNGTPGIPFIYGVVIEETSSTQYVETNPGEFTASLAYSSNPSVSNNSLTKAYYVSPAGSEAYVDESSMIDSNDRTFSDLYDFSPNGISSVLLWDSEHTDVPLSDVDNNMDGLMSDLLDMHDNNGRITPVAIGIIEVPSGQNTITQTYTFTEEWFNFTGVDQSSHAGKTYSYELKIVNLTDYLTSNDNNSGFTGTIYRITEDESYPGDNISVLTSGYETDKNNINNNYYLKQDIENDIIRTSYACARYTDNGVVKEVCVRGGDPSYYGTYDGMSSSTVYSITGATGNVKEISSIQNYIMRSANGECSYSSSWSSCGNHFNLFLTSNSNGSAQVSNYTYGTCMISETGAASCPIW